MMGITGCFKSWGLPPSLMVFNPEYSKDLEDDLVKARDAVAALRSEVYTPTFSRLLDDQVQLVQQEKDAQDKYRDLEVRRYAQKRILACATRAKLYQEWDAATKQLSDAVAALNRQIGTVSKADYTAMLTEIEAARLRSENARLSVELHRRNTAAIEHEIFRLI
jgi:hypothetical protein